jgi:hypothetical protein
MTGEAEAADRSEEISEESALFRAWSKLDEPKWMQDITRGGITQSRLDWLIYYALQVEMGEDLDASRIYETYQKWAAPKIGPIISSSQQVDTLLAYGAILQQFISESPVTPIGRFGQVAQGLDITVGSGVALAVAKNCDHLTQTRMFEIIESYLVRRETCGLPRPTT